MTAEVYTFKIVYEGLEDKIWRLAEVSSKYALNQLGYCVLATFDTMAYHLFQFIFRFQTYGIPTDEMDEFPEEMRDMADFRLEQLALKVGDVLRMDYDLGTTQSFQIELVSTRPMEKGAGRRYPRIMDGAGKGILDDCPSEELQELIDQIDTKGYTDEKIYYKDSIVPWDYREYDMKFDNMLLKGQIEIISDGFAPFWHND